MFIEKGVVWVSNDHKQTVRTGNVYKDSETEVKMIRVYWLDKFGGTDDMPLSEFEQGFHMLVIEDVPKEEKKASKVRRANKRAKGGYDEHFAQAQVEGKVA